ncbi:MAG: efflux RND transporter periplasmic adaptor subunit [Bacteroidota bacterium]
MNTQFQLYYSLLRKPYFHIPIYLISLLFISSFLTGCSSEAATDTIRQVRPVRYAEITMSGSPESHTFSGIAQSSKEAPLSFRVPGTITQLPVQIGQRVKRGTLIARVDPIDYSIQFDQSQAQLKSAETQVKSAQSQLASAKSNYERMERLYENNSVPLSEFEQAKTSYEGAQSQYEAALASVSTAQKQSQSAGNQVDYTRLIAPFSGIVTAVNAEENEQVGAGTPIALLSSEANPEVSLGMPDQFIARIKTGEKVDIHFAVLPDQTFKGTISEVGFSSSATSTYPVVVRLDKANNAIRPGMAADVTFFFSQTTNTEPILLTPIKAVGEGPEGKFAFVLQAQGASYQVTKQTIEIGPLHPGGFEIRSGLKEGDKVAVAGLSSLLDGMEVVLME